MNRDFFTKHFPACPLPRKSFTFPFLCPWKSAFQSHSHGIPIHIPMHISRHWKSDTSAYLDIGDTAVDKSYAVDSGVLQTLLVQIGSLNGYNARISSRLETYAQRCRPAGVLVQRCVWWGSDIVIIREKRILHVIEAFAADAIRSWACTNALALAVTIHRTSSSVDSKQTLSLRLHLHCSTHVTVSAAIQQVEMPMKSSQKPNPSTRPKLTCIG